MKIRLIRKLAEYVNGIDVSRHSVGDLLDLPEHDARMLVAEGWAMPAEPRHAPKDARREAADSRRSRRRRS